MKEVFKRSFTSSIEDEDSDCYGEEYARLDILYNFVDSTQRIRSLLPVWQTHACEHHTIQSGCLVMARWSRENRFPVPVARHYGGISTYNQ